MEYFRRFLGAVQETLDYVSSFTAYLLGDETHPGAEESGHTRGLEHRSSCHDSEVESAHSSGDVSPQGYLDAFERPLTAEVTPFNQESRVASEAVVNGAQTTEAILEPSKLACKCEGQEVAGQKLSESPQFLADAPKPRPTATVTGNEWQRDLEGLALIQGLHQWKSERTSLMEAIQPEGLEEVGLDTENSQHWEPDRPLTGGNREKEQNEVGGTDEAQQRKLEGTVWNEEIEHRTPDWALSVAEQPNGLKGAAWSGEIEHGRQLAKTSESQHLEEEEEEEEPPVAETVWDQQRETDRVEANEGIQKAMPERAETEGDQEGVLEEAERSHQSEPGKIVMAFEEQEWDPKRIAEERNSRQSGLEGAKDTEDYQQGELEGPLKNGAQAEDKRQEEQMEGVWEGMSERLVEEEDLEEKVLEKSETRGMQPWEPEWTERSLQEEPTGSRASLDTCLYAGEQIVGEPEKLTEEREEEQEVVVEVVMMEEAGTSEHRPWEPEGTERSLQEEPPWASPLDMYVFGGEQIVGEPEKLLIEEVEGVMLEEAETGGGQPWEPEGTERSLHDVEPTGSRASLDPCLFDGKQIGEPEKMTEEVAVVMLEEAENGGHQPWKSEESLLHEEPKGSNASLNTYLFGEEQIVGEPEKLIDEQEEEQEVVPLVVLEDAETGGGQPWEPEGTERSLHEEPMGNRASLNTCLFGGEQIVGEPEKLIEEQEIEGVMLEEAETGEGQPWEPEGSLLHEEPMGNRASLDTCLFGEEQIVVEPEKLTEELKEQEVVPLVVLEEAETGGGQPWEPEGTERSLHEEPMGNRASLDTCLFGGEQIVGEPEKLIEEQEEEQEVVPLVVLEDAETGGGQPWEPEGTERSLHDVEPTGSRASLDVCSLAGPSTFPDEVLPLDTSAQKERVMLRRKSSIRRAPSLKKPRLPMENQPPAANITEDVPSEPQAPRRPNLRHSGFGPMHPNMMAELQMRLRRPQ